MITATEFYDLQNAAVIGWNAAVKRCCDRQPTSHPENLTADTICSVTGLLPLYPFDVPEGSLVATGPMWVDIDEVNLTAHKNYATITIEEHEAQRAAWEAEQEAIAAQTALDQAAERRAAMAAKLTPGIVGLAVAYRTALRAMFGDGAEVNQQITQESVVGTLLQLPTESYDAKTADMLKLAFEQLSAIAGDGTTWTFFETVGDLIPEAV
jgi:hypothetical protein